MFLKNCVSWCLLSIIITFSLENFLSKKLVNGHIQVGSVIYNYEFESYLNITTHKNSSSIDSGSNKGSINYLLQAKINVQPIKFHQSNSITFNLKIEQVKTVEDNGSLLFSVETLEAITSNGILFDFDVVSKKITNLKFNNKKETRGSLIFKKSVLDLFNLNYLENLEESVVGNCKTISTISDESSEILIIKKLKYDCIRSKEQQQQTFNDEYKRNEKVLNSLIDRKIEIDYKLSKTNDYLILNAQSNDISKIYSGFYSKSYNLINSKQTLTLIGETKIDQDFNSNVDLNQKESLEINSEIENLSSILKQFDANLSRTDAEKQFQKLLKSYVKKLKFGTSQSCLNYLGLIKLTRNYFDTKVQFLQQILSYYFKKDKIAKVAMEAYLASQTESALKALLNVLDLSDLKNKLLVLNSAKSKLVEDMLISSSLMTRSNTNLLNALVSLFNSKMSILNIKELSALSIGSLVHLADKNQSETIHKSFDLLIDEFKKSSREDVKLIYLESLKNTRHPKVYEIIEDELTNKNSNRVSLSSFKYLETLTAENKQFSDKILKNSILIFENFNKKSSDELRIEALGLLLDKFIDYIVENESSILENIFYTLNNHRSSKSSKEFLFYCLRLIFNKMNLNEQLRIKVNKVLLNPNIKLSIFDFYLNNGASTFNSHPFYQMSSGSLNYKIKQLMSDDGFIKSLDFSVGYVEDEDKSQLDFLKFELYANNLGSLNSKENSDKNANPSASLHLSLMGKKIKIVELFNSYSGMISAIWNLPTKMTSIFDINFLIGDQKEYLILQNGMILRLETLAAISFDLSGSTDISFWSQYAKIKIKKNIALRIEQKLALINDQMVQSESQIDFDTQIAVDFNLNINFKDSPTKVCTKMSNRKFYLKKASKITHFKLNKIKSINKSQKKIPIQPLTFMFSRKAVEFC